MLAFAILLTLSVPGAADVEPTHRDNEVYHVLLNEGLKLKGTHVEFDKPILIDGQSADSQRKALAHVAGSDSRLEELLRDSVTAPSVLKLRDETLKNGDVIRRGDLWFVVRADLDTIKPEELSRKQAEGKPVSAGNMRFATHLLNGGEQLDRGLIGAHRRKENHEEWFAHIDGRLLDRIEVRATDHIVATRSKDSWVFASQTDSRFNDDKSYPNRWRELEAKGEESKAKGSLYPGGASYVKISRLADPAGALLVESHFAFLEPHAWFDGEPILRSKINLIAQDQIRRLRRDLAKAKSQ